MHRWIIACIILAFMAQSALVYGQTDPSYLKGEEWTDEAGAKVTTLYFTLGDKEWPNADPFRMVVIGDSIAWGCGLDAKEKYSYLTADWLQKELKRPVEVTILAHTGATLDTSKSGGHIFFDPELSSWDPTILEQIDKINNPEHVDLILLSGGINDIGVDKILDPTADSNDIINTCSSIENSMYNVLIKLLNKCKNAKIVVTSYYLIVSNDTPEPALNDFAKVLSSIDPNYLHRVGASLVKDNPITKLSTPEEKVGTFVLESIAFNLMRSNSKAFDNQFREHIGNSEGGAVFEANKYSRAHFDKDRVIFASIDFPSDKSYGTSGSWLWKLIDTNDGGKTDDHKYAYRVSLCDNYASCNWDDKIDAIGHPNVEGAGEYNRAIVQKISETWPDWLHPIVLGFEVSPSSLTFGESFNINYNVSSNCSEGLRRVELWRKNETSNWKEIKRNIFSGEIGPISGSFADSLSVPGKYWYGVHVVDNAGNWNDQRNSNTNNKPGVYGPIEVEVKKNQLVTLTLYVHDGDANGPIIPDALVTGQDGSGNEFRETTNEEGYVTISRESGTWSFSASADGYETNNWDQEISETSKKHAYLQREETQQESPDSAASESQGPENSVVGKWIIQSDWKCDGNTFECGIDGNEECPPYEINFYKDGTLIDDEGNSGKWEQQENVISWQYIPNYIEREDGSADCFPTYEGTIRMNAMEGAFSIVDPRCDGSGCWTAVRADAIESENTNESKNVNEDKVDAGIPSDEEDIQSAEDGINKGDTLLQQSKHDEALKAYDHMAEVKAAFEKELPYLQPGDTVEKAILEQEARDNPNYVSMTETTVNGQYAIEFVHPIRTIYAQPFAGNPDMMIVIG